MKKRGDQTKSASIKLGVILIGLIIFGYAEVRGEDWVRYGKKKTGSYYYDRQSVTRQSKDIVGVCNKIVFTNKGVAKIVERLGKSYESVGYVISLKEINCTDKTQHWISSNVYSKKGELLSTPPCNIEWESIIQGTLSDILLQKVCNLVEKEINP